MCAATPDEGDAEKRPEHGDCPVEADVRLRIEDALRNESFRRLGAEFHLHAETIRRQLRGNAGVSLRVLAAACAKTGVSADWLLFGTGPKLSAERIDHALRTAPVQLLVDALAERVKNQVSHTEAPARPAEERERAHAAEALVRLATLRTPAQPPLNGSNGLNPLTP